MRPYLHLAYAPTAAEASKRMSTIESTYRFLAV